MAIDSVLDELVHGISLIGPRGFIAKRLAAFDEADLTTPLVRPMVTDPVEVRALRRATPEATACLTSSLPRLRSSPATISRVELIRLTAEAPSRFEGGAAAGPGVAAGGGASTDGTLGGYVDPGGGTPTDRNSSSRGRRFDLVHLGCFFAFFGPGTGGHRWRRWFPRRMETRPTDRQVPTDKIAVQPLNTANHPSIRRSDWPIRHGCSGHREFRSLLECLHSG